MALAVLVLLLVRGLPAAACPFCTAQAPTLCQREASSAVTLLAELESRLPGGAARLAIHRVHAGKELLTDPAEFVAPLDLAARPGDLLLLFGQRNVAGDLSWHAEPVNETSYGYFVSAPRAGDESARLAYFARYLEHANPLVAEDAYLEFGHAAFESVAACADQLPAEKLRRWVVDPGVPPHRHGFYGLALGLARDNAVRRKNQVLLESLIAEPADDFRAGFDGLLGGYLLLTGTTGLERLEDRYFRNPSAAVGDVRHAMTALRFYREYGHEIAVPRLAAAARHLLARPEFAEATIIDLARWQSWDDLSTIAALYGTAGYDEPAIARAIIGYLHACPGAEARQRLARLRERDPQGVATAEAVLSRTGGVPSAS